MLSKSKPKPTENEKINVICGPRPVHGKLRKGR